MPQSLHSAPSSLAVGPADQLWFSCPSCKGELKVPLALANSTGACPLCGERVQIPAKSDRTSSPIWAGQADVSLDPDTGLPVDDPEVDGDTRKCFRGDLHFLSGAADPQPNGKRGFFEAESDLLVEVEAEPVRGLSSISTQTDKPRMEAFAKPLRKFTEPPPVAPTVVKEPPPPAPEPIVAEAKEAKAEVPLASSLSLEKENSLFKPIRKYPPKQRRKQMAAAEAAKPESIAPVPPPLPVAVPVIVKVPEAAPAFVVPPPVVAPVIVKVSEAAPAFVAPPPVAAPAVVNVPEAAPAFVAPPPVAAPAVVNVPEAAPAFVAPPPVAAPVIVKVAEVAPAFVAPPPVVAPVIVKVSEAAPAFVAPPPVAAPAVVNVPEAAPAFVAPPPVAAPAVVNVPEVAQSSVPLPLAEALVPEPVLTEPPAMDVVALGQTEIEIERVVHPGPAPVLEEVQEQPEDIRVTLKEAAVAAPVVAPEDPAKPDLGSSVYSAADEAPSPQRRVSALVIKALERSVGARLDKGSKEFTDGLRSIVPVPVSDVPPTSEPFVAAAPREPVTPTQPEAPTPVTRSIQLRSGDAPAMAAPLPQAAPIAAYVELIPETEPLHDVSPAVIGEQEPSEEHLPLRIGGVVMPRYTLIPRGSQLRLWGRRAAIGLLFLSPLALFSDFYMPHVRRVVEWIDEMKRSRVHLEDIQKQAALNRSSPAAQDFEKDALSALRRKWTQLTTPAPKQAAGAASLHPVVFRSSKTDATATSPETDWPQLLLRNYGTFRGHSPMEGASSFLIEAPDGSHWVATSVHLLGPAGGVEPPVPPGKLVTDLDHWRAHLPDKPDTYAEVVGGRRLMTVITADWLAMKLTSSDAVLPVKPLHLRRTLLLPDEPVFLIGLPYDDKSGATQHIYRGQVTTTSPLDPGQFAFVVQEQVDFSGFRGAPILDAEGEVVGVLTDRMSSLLLGTRSELLSQLMDGK